jgi:hypothetical protein
MIKALPRYQVAMDSMRARLIASGDLTSLLNLLQVEQLARTGSEAGRIVDLLASLHRDFGITLTLLCACPEYRICHRSLLAELIGAAVNLDSPRTTALL